MKVTWENMKVTWENTKVYYILKYSEKYTKKAGSNSETSLFKIKLSYFEKAESSMK